MCEYGCNQAAEFTLKNGKQCCSKSSNSCPAQRHKNSEGCKRSLHLPFIKNRKGIGGGWNRGLTKETNETIAKASLAVRGKYKSGELAPPFKGRHHSEETKQKLREAGIRSQAEGRSWNIGQSRWNNEPSYPEQFFMQVIENEFRDKDYIREYPLGRFSLDFAWEKKKKCIEIDGEQHYSFPGYAERDIRKNKAIEDASWSLLRIRWTEMYKDTKTWIQKAREFIEK